MKANFILFLLLLPLVGCDPASASSESPSEPPAAPPAPPPIDPQKDFELQYEYGIINGSPAPATVQISSNSRYFDFGGVEVRTEGHASLSGEKIRYRRKNRASWKSLPKGAFTFFIGYDGHRHLIIDQGTGPDQREIRLFDIKEEQSVYQSAYNNALLRNGWLYLLRYIEPARLEQLPDCDTSRIPAQHLGYEQAVAVQLEQLQEFPTGQVFCTYRQ